MRARTDMVIDTAALSPMLAQLLPVALSALSPMVTALVSQGVAAAGNKVPSPIKPVINVLIGAVVAGLAGANPVVGMVGAQVGNHVREAMASAAPAAPTK